VVQGRGGAHAVGSGRAGSPQVCPPAGAPVRAVAGVVGARARAHPAAVGQSSAVAQSISNRTPP